MSTGGVLAATGLQPMFPLDPNSPFKPVFNPALLPYRYPFGMAQPLKPFSSQGPVTPLTGGVSTAQAASALQAMYPLTAGANLAAFQNASETGGVAPGSTTAPPLLQMQPLPNQQQPFPGMMQPPSLLPPGSKDDKGEDKVQGLNWIQNPAALMGSAGYGVMPYLIGQNQLGIGPPGLGVPGGQPGVNLLNSTLPGGPIGGSDGGLGKVGTLQESMLLSRNPQTPLLRGSSTSGDIPRDSIHHRAGDVSPSHTPPLAGGGSKMSQFQLAPPDAGKWMNMGLGGEQAPQQIMYGLQNPPGASSPYPASSVPGHVITNSGHVMPIGFSPTVGSNSPVGPYLPKNRGEGLGHGSPRATHEKLKLRIHQVRNDDFKMQVKPDRRRKKWRGKDKDILLSTRAELTDSAVRRLGIGILTGEPGPLMMDSAPIRALPASLGVEPGLKQPHNMENTSAPPSTTTRDGNYALNILADMSSIQSKEGRGAQDEGHHLQNKPLNGPTSTVDTHLRSPVSLAARSLLMLGEDMNIPEGSHAATETTGSSDVSHFESTAASSLLQLSGARCPESSDKVVAEPPDVPCADSGLQASSNTQTRSARSASFSAAEAMIMMVSGSEEKTPQDGHGLPPSPLSSLEGQQPALERAQKLTQKPAHLRLDSEVTDTDSEATLTPESPSSKKFTRLSSFPSVDEKQSSASDEVGISAENGAERESKLEDNGNIVGKDAGNVDTAPATSNHVSDAPRVDNTAPPIAESNAVSTEHLKPSADSEPLSPEHTLTMDTCEDESANDSPHVPLESTPSSEDTDKPSNVPMQMESESNSALTYSELENEPPSDTPPPAKRPKFISTFGPAADDDDDKHSLTPLGGDGTDKEGTGSQTPPGEDGLGEEETEKETTSTSIAVSAECGTTDTHHSAESAGDTLPLDSNDEGVDEGVVGGVKLADKGVAEEEGEEPLPNTRSQTVDADREESISDGVVVHTAESAEQVQTSEVSEAPMDVAIVSNAPPTSEVIEGTSAASVADGAASPAKSTKKVKAFKRSKDGSVSAKIKSLHGKTRVIKIKRAKSPKLAKTIPSTPPGVDSGNASPSSWADFADAAVSQDTSKETPNTTTESDSVKNPPEPSPGEAVPSQSEDRQGTSESETTREASAKIVPSESAMPSVEDALPDGDPPPPPPATPMAPQNRLKVSRVGSSQKQHQHKPSGSLQAGKTGKPEDKRKTPKVQHEDLFEVDLPVAKKDMKKDSVKPKQKKLPARGHPSDKVSDKSKSRSNKVSDSDDSTPHTSSHGTDRPSRTRDTTKGSSRELKPRPHPSTSKGRTSSPAQRHSPLNLRECGREFSPLSDDDLNSIMKQPKEVRPGKPVEEEERKYKGRRRHPGTVEESSLPSPSSPLGSKQHHRRHHDRSGVGLASDSQHTSKQDHRSDHSGSQGPSPERKRHHNRHYRHHHHSNEGRSRDSSRHSSTTRGEAQRRPYESISDDDMFDVAGTTPLEEEEGLGRRSLHDGTLPVIKSSSGRKRQRISSDDNCPEDESEMSESDRHALGPSKHKKTKHSSKEQKQRWKESNLKHKHSHKQH